MTDWDTTELGALVRDLEKAPARLKKSAGAEMKRGATRLKKKMVLDASDHRYLKSFADKVNKSQDGPLDWQIGFDKRGQGKLANIIVFGSVNNAPVYDFARPLWTEGMALERRLAEDVEQAVLGEKT